MARIKKFESLVRAFTEKNEPSRARMNTRLMNQLKEALVRSRKGLPIQPETLPVPPGFEKLPASLPTKPPARRPAAAEVPAAAAEPPKDAPLTVAEQKKILVDKQLQFKQHALKAKKNGDLPAAAKFLKASKVGDLRFDLFGIGTGTRDCQAFRRCAACARTLPVARRRGLARDCVW